MSAALCPNRECGDVGCLEIRLREAEKRIAELESGLETALVYVENGDFRNGITDQSGQIDQGQVWQGEAVVLIRGLLGRPLYGIEPLPAPPDSEKEG